MPLHSCETHTEDRQSKAPRTQWHKIQGKDACKRDKKGNAFNNWRTVPK